MSTSDHERPGFLVVACSPGVEPWLKAEIAREHPALRPSFSRPGLVTFKQGAEPIAPEAVRSVFARTVATSHGALPEGQRLDDFVRARMAAVGGQVRVLVHAGKARVTEGPRSMSRSLHPPLAEQASAAIVIGLADLAGAGRAIGGLAEPGEHVIDVFTAPEEALWLGEHVHTPSMQPWASGLPPIQLPHDAPSRAFLKIEEAIAWAGLPVRAGQLAIEIGSAPGGASLALLRRGVSVIGVDPAAMDPIVTAFDGASGSSFRHLQVPVGALGKADLPKVVDWLALDVNLAPPVALRYAERIIGPRREHLRGAVLTLKMNDAAMAAQIPALLERVRAMGFGEVRATQLPTNRSEICVVALGRGRDATASSRSSSKASRAARSSALRRGSRGPTST